MQGLTVGVVVIVVVLLLLLLVWKKAPQDKAIVVTGLKKRIISGGGGIVIPVFEQVDRISLETIKVEVKTSDSLDRDGVPLCTDGVVLVKIRSEKESILEAMEQFNTGKEKETIDVIRSTVQDILEGKIREIVSQLSIEELYSSRQMFSDEVEKVAKDDLERMGLEIKSFTIRDIDDHNGYLKALGVKQIAQVKKEAAIAQAEADREQTERTAEAKRKGEEARLIAEAEIAKAEKEKELKIQAYKEEKDAAKAMADSAYVIKENEVKQKIIETRTQAEMLEEKKQTEIAKQQAARKQEILVAEVNKKADAEKYRIEKAAEADKFRVEKEAEAKLTQEKKEAEAEAYRAECVAKAESEAIRLMGQAEAEAIRAKGKAKADALIEEAKAKEKLAEAMAKYGDAAILQMVVDKLPAIMAESARAVGQIDKITILDNGGNGASSGASKVANLVTDITGSGFEAVKAMTGIDLVEVIKGFNEKTSFENEISLEELEKVNEEISQDTVKLSKESDSKETEEI